MCGKSVGDGSGASSCFCDTNCLNFGDCCPDYENECAGGAGILMAHFFFFDIREKGEDYRYCFFPNNSWIHLHCVLV